MMAALFEITQSDSGDSLAQQHRMEHELRGFIRGLPLFSKRIGISIDRLLIFSIANDQKLLNEHLQKKKVCRMKTLYWQSRYAQ
jgi:hypothetical protein